MKKYEYTHFIPENVAPKGATKIIVKDKDGKVVATASLGKLKPPSTENKLYSFGVLSDVHVNTTYNEIAYNRFKNAVKYLIDEEKVAFICIAGDLTNSGTESDIKEYIALTQIAKGACNNKDNGGIVIHDTTGNHDVQTKSAEQSYFQEYADGVEPYASRELFYSFNHGDDLFIMFGMTSWPGQGALYSDDSYDWLEKELAANKDKRCFLFSHPPYFTTDATQNNGNGIVVDSGSGAIVGYPPPTGTYIQWYSESAPRFKNALNSHPNLIWFHGHSHVEFFYQEIASYVNYCRENFESNNLPGVHSIHVPSLAVGREPRPNWAGWTAPAGTRGGEGYIVDVYQDCIHLRGYDFDDGKIVPIATYCLETTSTN